MKPTIRIPIVRSRTEPGTGEKHQEDRRKRSMKNVQLKTGLEPVCFRRERAAYEPWESLGTRSTWANAWMAGLILAIPALPSCMLFDRGARRGKLMNG